MAKPKLTDYQIRVWRRKDDGGPEFDQKTVRGYVAGDFACRKHRYSYDFTHLPTGFLIGGVGWYERKAEALTRLSELGERGLDALPDHIADALREAAAKA
jgi:hypothetical protein